MDSRRPSSVPWDAQFDDPESEYEEEDLEKLCAWVEASRAAEAKAPLDPVAAERAAVRAAKQKATRAANEAKRQATKAAAEQGVVDAASTAFEALEAARERACYDNHGEPLGGSPSCWSQTAATPRAVTAKRTCGEHSSGGDAKKGRGSPDDVRAMDLDVR